MGILAILTYKKTERGWCFLNPKGKSWENHHPIGGLVTNYQPR